MDNNRYPNILLHGYGSGQRPRGRPKKKSIDNIKEDCTDMGISINEAMKLVGERNVWRSTVLNLQGLPAHEDFVIVAEALSQVSHTISTQIFKIFFSTQKS